MLKKGISKFLFKRQFYQLNLLHEKMAEIVNKTYNYNDIMYLVKENRKDFQDPLNMDLILKRVLYLEKIDKIQNEKFIPLVSDLVNMSRTIKPQNRLLFYKFLCNNNIIEKDLWIDIFRDLKKLSKNILKSDNMVIIMNLYSFVLKNKIFVDKIDYVFIKILKEIERNKDYIEKIDFSQSISLLNGFDLYFKKKKNPDNKFLSYLKGKAETNFDIELQIDNKYLKEIIFENEEGFDILNNILSEIKNNYNNIQDIDKDLVKTVN